MREAWRWFGPNDPVTLDEIRQTGATDIVSALHNIPAGEVWTKDAIGEHQSLIEQNNEGLSPLTWSVVESIPVHESIKLGESGCQVFIDNWITSMENLAACGIKVICYNFMPVIDWTRTDLDFKLPNGAYALRFDQNEFAAFDLYILQREAAESEYSQQERKAAKAVYDAMEEEQRSLLTRNIIAGLPGKMTDAYTLDDFRDMLARYKHIDGRQLRDNLFSFLAKVLPRAEALGVKLGIHPDDPPRDMLGLPRVVCTADDLDLLFHQLPSPSNGVTLCVGTFSSRPDNDLPYMAKHFGSRIHFSHLRGVKLDPNEQRTFFEAGHLDSDVDMVRVIQALLEQEVKRKKDKEAIPIFIRPDHGHRMMGDIGKQVNPGYSGIGRLKGLAEIRGVIKALSVVNAYE
ncbi:mannonate dehydratase [Glaciecola sp. XM2]|uniref:mannonate dehydratase n=1 Tax=Glaciecola sp. XM2 TaxID=1914931 RepID=UPI001BDF4A67|nr:mannonate dehydratase [Glaciecola sp. XM2]MBT1450778.1 mannonate dehydratase [Glaciecola sp. XM2]